MSVDDTVRVTGNVNMTNTLYKNKNKLKKLDTYE